MDRQLIKTLIDALQASGLSELEYTHGDETLRLVKGGPGLRTSYDAPPGAMPQVPVPPQAPLPPDVPPAIDAGIATAPLYGIAHLRPAPGAPPFVTQGQAVEAGQVLCTVEAMKVFTEVRAGRAGTVEAILVADGQEVEPGQPLVRVG